MFIEVSGGNFQESFSKKARLSSYSLFCLFSFSCFPLLLFQMWVQCTKAWLPSATLRTSASGNDGKAKIEERRPLVTYVSGQTNAELTYLLSWKRVSLFLHKPPVGFSVLADEVIPDMHALMQEILFISTIEQEGMNFRACHQDVHFIPIWKIKQQHWKNLTNH